MIEREVRVAQLVVLPGDRRTAGDGRRADGHVVAQLRRQAQYIDRASWRFLDDSAHDQSLCGGQSAAGQAVHPRHQMQHVEADRRIGQQTAEFSGPVQADQKILALRGGKIGKEVKNARHFGIGHRPVE